MDLDLFRKVSNSNAAILQKCLQTRSSDLSEIMFWEGHKGKDLSFDQLLAKSYDILGCCAIGAIPSMKKSGADGYIRWANDPEVVHEIETKVCAIESKNIHVGARGGLYWSSDPTNTDNRAAINSHFAGSFDAKMTDETMQSKARYTSLICFDRDQNKVIDAWIMKPDVILTEIKKRQNNKSINIKLTRFLLAGSKMGTKIDNIGWDQWQLDQIKSARVSGRLMCGRT